MKKHFMTKQKALDILEEMQDYDDTMYAYDEIYMEALNIALDALRKEIKNAEKEKENNLGESGLHED